MATLCGCANFPGSIPKNSTAIDVSRLPRPDLVLEIEGITSCQDGAENKVSLDSKSEVNLLVHGCYASSGRLRDLSQLFAFQGQQSICFSYDDRDSMLKVAKDLKRAISELGASIPNLQLNILGHSQGGLIARKALTIQPDDAGLERGAIINLATISSPFSGIEAADHCASDVARLVSLGLVIPICKAISGDKWYEITSRSDFMLNPGTLNQNVRRHLKINTDETDTCRQLNASGRCVESDFVFSLDEQYNQRVDKMNETENIEIHAGHAEIIGLENRPPYKLVELLQKEGYLKPVAEERRLEFERLLASIYSRY